MAVTISVNGVDRSVDVPTDTPLLYVLRDELGLNGARYGCGYGQCGACTVHVDGASVRSCLVPARAVVGKKVVTVEGLKKPDGELHPLQKAFLTEQAGQCGYCLPGMMMSAAALLSETANPSELDIRSALEENLCRCGSHNRIVRAVKRAAAEMAR
jgi:nicotinate dehydrogenase subunit A